MSLDGLRVTALMPMKAHSERVEQKNFRLLNGKPLFRWMLDTLLSASEIDVVVLNTDAREILRDHSLVDSERVMIRDRKPELCGDLVSMNLILEDDLNNVESDIYVMTHATNPFVSKRTVSSALEAYRSARAAGDADSLFTVTKYQTRFYRKDGSPVNHDPDVLVRTQDLEPWFEENSNLYVFSGESFKRTGARIGARPLLFETPALESLDIDNPEDWVLAELMASTIGSRGNAG